MKRRYRITVVIERTFDRKATKEAEFIRNRLVHFTDLLEGWSNTKARISSSAKAERAPRITKEPDDGTVEYAIAKGQALAMLREIAASMAAILGNIKKPRIEWANNYWCDSVRGGAGVAHSHNQAGVRLVNDPSRVGKRAGRKIPKGLICVTPKAILGNPSAKLPFRREPRYSDPANWPELMAHEIMHLRMPGGSHHRENFRKAVDDLVKKYAEART